MNHRWRRIAAVALPVGLTSIAAFASAGSSAAPVRSAADRAQSTKLISHAFTGVNKVPNGPSTNAVISNDRRWARIVAYQSDASNIVRGDTNRQTDVFAVRRAGHFGNRGTRWRLGKTKLISRARRGRANGPSYSPAVDGAFKTRPKCVAFLSRASNLVAGDRNNVADAFVSRGPGGRPKLVSLLPGNRRAKADATAVAVSGDCSEIAFVSGGKLYVRIKGRKTKALKAPGAASNPSFSTGKLNDLVFAAGRGVYYSRGGKARPRLVAPGGSDPAMNDIKRRTITYVVHGGGNTQIGYRDLGHGQKIISRRGGRLGNGDSSKPVIGNSGFYVTFETNASNLGITPAKETGDNNGVPDVYLYSDVRKLTLIESVKERGGVPTASGGANPSMAFYANYILFDAPYKLKAGTGSRQVFMRWLGAV
jgi:hypothetical protein